MSYTPLRPDSGDATSLRSPEIEQRLLGALLISNRAFEDVSEFVNADDFGTPVHGRIFAAIGKLIEDGGEANPVTLGPAFATDSALEAMGSGKFLFELAQTAVTVTNARDYAKHIADLAKRRRALKICEEAMFELSEVDLTKPANVLLEQIEDRIFGLSDRRAVQSVSTAKGMIEDSIDNVQDFYRRPGRLGGIPSGFPNVDSVLGGFFPKDLIVLAGRPSMGKTALATQILTAAARKGYPSAMFSLEQPAVQLGHRMLAFESGISTTFQVQRAGELTERNWDGLIEAQRVLSKLPLWVDEAAGLSIAQMALRTRRWCRKHKLEFLVVDYLQLMRGSGSRQAQNSRVNEITEITVGLKQLAKDLGIPILLLSQLNRGVENRDDKRPGLADLRDSGSIEQDADVVLFIYREEYYLREPAAQKAEETEEKYNKRLNLFREARHRVKGKAEVLVAKNRHGRAPYTITMNWEPELTRFTAAADEAALPEMR